MKLFVKRDQFNIFQKGKIELDTSTEWTIISSALKTELKNMMNAINFYERLIKENSKAYSESNHQWCIERKSKIEEMIVTLEQENELVCN